MITSRDPTRVLAEVGLGGELEGVEHLSEPEIDLSEVRRFLAAQGSDSEGRRAVAVRVRGSIRV